jgi:hypothetical protein
VEVYKVVIYYTDESGEPVTEEFTTPVEGHRIA